MSRTGIFSRLARTLRIAKWCDDRGLPTREGIEQAQAAEERWRISRRQMLGGMVAGAAITAVPRRVMAASLDVGIVGAGLAGLSCADRLKQRGTTAKLYEASDRPGGRCFSLRGVFP